MSANALEIPQATLGRIRQVVDAIAAGASTALKIATAKEISRRQADYGSSAAIAIGLVDRESSSNLVLNESGKALAASAEGSPEERNLLRDRIVASSAMRQIAPGLLDDAPPAKAEIVRRIVSLGSLSESTAAHRASMLLKWRAVLLGQTTARQTPTPVPKKPGYGRDLSGHRRSSAVRPGFLSPTWVRVENFKSIRELSLELLPFMVFVGPNAAGKTNLVQAIALLFDLLEEGTTEPVELYGGLEQLIRRARRRTRHIGLGARFEAHLPRVLRAAPEPNTVTLEHNLRLVPGTSPGDVCIGTESLRILRADGTLGLECAWRNGKVLRLEASGEWKALASLLKRQRDARSVNFAWLLRILGVIRFPSLRRLRLDASALRQDSQLTTLRHGHGLGPAGEGLPLAVERLRKMGRLPSILAGLREVYPRIAGIEPVHVLPGRVGIAFKEDSIEGPLGPANVSDGVIHALALLVALESGGPLAIEEPENALHPWALRKLLSTAQKRELRGPLLLTTHSPVAVDAVADPANLYIVEHSTSAGTTVAKAVEKERALRAILSESGQSLGQVWLGGGLGGVPGEG